MKIAITGGAGYIGCRLSEQLLNHGHEVVCIDWLKWGIEPILNIIDRQGFSLHAVDIRSSEVDPLIKEADAVIHLAGIVGFPACNAEPDLAFKVNIEGTKRIVDLSADKPFVYASTGSVYGQLDSTCTEESETNPISTYSVYKMAGEEYINNSSNAVILRPATAFGVSNRLRHDLLVNDFTRKALLDGHMTLFEGHFKRTFISVNDLARSFRLAIENHNIMKGQVWNVGDQSLNHTKLEICETIKSHIPDFTFDNNQEFSHDQDGRNYFVDYKKIRDIGFIATETLDQGIQNLIKIYTATNKIS